MPDLKISELPDYTTPVDADLFAIVDTANDITKKVTKGDVAASINVMTQAGDIIIGGAGGSPERLGIGGANTVLHGGVSQPAYSAVVEADITLSANATNNVNTTRHGFAPVLSNVSTQFLNGQGNWATPSGIANAYISQSFNTQTSVTVTHNFGTYPVVQIVDNTGAVIIPLTVTHGSVNAFTVTFSTATTGNILATVGSPQLNTFIHVTDDYTTVANDYIVKQTTASKTIKLATAIGSAGKILILKNASSGNMDVTCNVGGQTIDGITTITLSTLDSITVYSDGSNYSII